MSHNGKQVLLSQVLIDTGSASTIISADTAIELALKPGPLDKICRIHGIGGSEFVYEQLIDNCRLGSAEVPNFLIQVGAMDYGFKINAILGTDFLMAAKIVIDMGKRILYNT